jgi:hypothetical protein
MNLRFLKASSHLLPPNLDMEKWGISSKYQAKHHGIRTVHLIQKQLLRCNYKFLYTDFLGEFAY